MFRWSGAEAPRSLVAALVVIGAAVRISEYATNRSLWLDESFLALNILRRPLTQLVQPLDFNQGAPIGFLAFEKLVSAAFGSSEYSLRLVPLLAGLAAVLVFVRVARQVLPSPAVPLAVGFFAISDGSIRYSSEAKQYSCDVLATLVLTSLALSLAAQPSRRRMLLAAALGGGVILFSHAAILVAPTLAAVVIAGARRTRGHLGAETVMPAVVWTVVAVGGALLAAYQLSHIRETLNIGSKGAQPHALSAGVDGASLVEALMNSVSAVAPDLGVPGHGAFVWIGYIFLLLAAFGVFALWKRDETATALVLGPIGVTAAAVAAGAYPLLSRTILFLLPAFILLASAAVLRLISARGGRRVAAAALVITVLIWPSKLALQHLVRPPHFQEIKGALLSVGEHWRPGDALYLHYASQYAFAYYAECGCFDMSPGGRLWPVRESRLASSDEFSPAIRSVPPILYVGPYRGHDWDGYLRDVRRVKGRSRVWFLFTHASDRAEAHFEDVTFPAYLDALGRREEEYVHAGARAYLYNLAGGSTG